MRRYRVLCADPPWQLGDKLPGKGRGAAKNYELLSVEDLCAFPLPPMLDDSICFMWRLSSMQQEALVVMKAWGFELKTEIVWNKLTKNGKKHFGMGRTVRAAHETCIVGWRGRVEIQDKGIRSTFEAPTPTTENGHARHSAKPEFFYTDIVEKLVKGPYVELFSRATRRNWVTLGNQVPDRL